MHHTNAEWPIANIVVGSNRRRGIDEKAMEGLMLSISENGLINPIAVRNIGAGKASLIAGLHRLEAHKRLGRQKIRVVVLDASDDQAELVEIDENLARAELPHADRLVLLIRRMELAQRIAAQKQAIAEQALSSCGLPIQPSGQARAKGGQTRANLGSVRGSVKRIGIPRTTVQRAKKAEETIGTDKLKKLSGTSLQSAREIDALVKLPEHRRTELIQRAIAGEKVTAIKQQPRLESYKTTALREFDRWLKRWQGRVPELEYVSDATASIRAVLKR